MEAFMINRRTVLGYIAGNIAATSTVQAQNLSETQPDDKRYADYAASDGWMQSWMDQHKRDFQKENPGAPEKAAADSLFLGRFADRMYFTVSVIG